MIRRVGWATTGLAILSLPLPLAAQGAGRAGLTNLDKYAHAPQARTDKRRPVPVERNHWVTGALVGGAVGLWLGLSIQSSFPHDTDDPGSARFYFLIPTFAFAALGGMIGSSIKSH